MKAVATLVIYAYSSFVASWGMGPGVAKEFEKTCACKVELVNGGDGGSLLNKIKLEGKDTRADLVRGLDETLLPRAKKAFEWDKVSLPPKTKIVRGLGPVYEGRFLPYDQPPYAFIYDSKKLKQPP